MKAKVPVVEESEVVGNRACSHLAMNHERARMSLEALAQVVGKKLS